MAVAKLCLHVCVFFHYYGGTHVKTESESSKKTDGVHVAVKALNSLFSSFFFFYVDVFYNYPPSVRPCKLRKLGYLKKLFYSTEGAQGSQEAIGKSLPPDMNLSTKHYRGAWGGGPFLNKKISTLKQFHCISQVIAIE